MVLCANSEFKAVEVKNGIRKICVTGDMLLRATEVHYNSNKSPTRCNSFSSFLLDVYLQLNMFWASYAHHQELNNCSSSLWFYLWSVVIAVLLVMVGPAGPTTTNSTAKNSGSLCDTLLS